MLYKWQIKAVVQKVISYLPYPNRINYFFQKYITKGVYLTDEYFELKIQHAKDHLDFCENYISINTNNRILELGTGWYPIIPLFFYLRDCGNVTSIDIQNWIRRENLLLTIQKYLTWDLEGKLQKYLAEPNSQKMEKLREIIKDPDKYSVEEIHNEIGLKCEIQDARDLDYEDNTYDLICSNNTFEHINSKHLEPIIKEFKRIAKPNSLMSHFIDLSDHFAHFDNKITIYNFLRYSRSRWKCIDNNIQPQNRLRFVDYKRIYQDIGIPVTEEVTRDGNMEELQQVSVHKEFAQYSNEQLAVSHGYIISHMKTS